jgi:hypothetical protein
MSNQWQGEERREHPRVTLKASGGRKKGSVIEPSVVDVSLSGALLELSSMLPSKSRYVLQFPTDDGEALELAGEVVRSYVHGFDNDASGRPSVKYRAAIQFVDMSPETESELEAILTRS